MFFDKTGTLTNNELKFKAVAFNGFVCESDTLFDILNQIYANNCKEVELLFKCFVICNDLNVIRGEHGQL